MEKDLWRGIAINVITHLINTLTSLSGGNQSERNSVEVHLLTPALPSESELPESRARGKPLYGGFLFAWQSWRGKVQRALNHSLTSRDRPLRRR